MHIPESLAEGFPGLGKYIWSWLTLSESRADSPVMTLYFRFHSGPMKGIQHSHRAHLLCF